MQRFNMFIGERLLTKLRRYADKQGVTVSGLIRSILVKFFEENKKA
jgi:hypothetical protein